VFIHRQSLVNYNKKINNGAERHFARRSFNLVLVKTKIWYKRRVSFKRVHLCPVGEEEKLAASNKMVDVVVYFS